MHIVNFDDIMVSNKDHNSGFVGVINILIRHTPGPYPSPTLELLLLLCMNPRSLKFNLIDCTFGPCSWFQVLVC